MKYLVSAVALAASTAALTVTFANVATAAPQLERVRGTIESATDTALKVKTAEGATRTVVLAPKTAVVSVAKSSLDNVTDGKFIGTATKGENPPVALEVVIFPASMKGTGEGHYDWDAITDTTGGKAPVKSSMTNGTIKTSSTPLTKSSMTNGTVKAGTASGGGKSIDVTYDNGQSLKIKVPSSAPIVEFVPADRAILAPGAKVFAVTAVDGDNRNGVLVAVGKDGLTPPM